MPFTAAADRLTIPPRESDIGNLMVRRLLPWRGRRAVGPFVFFDHMGPAEQAAGSGIDVRPHPHIGLATVTWLFEGRILHHDSLGCRQAIEPGAVNWMIAGRGIVHSERTAAEDRAVPRRVHGVQAWVALPAAEEERAPSFEHHPAGTLPVIDGQGWRATLIAGTAWGETAPATVLSPLFYLDMAMTAGAEVDLPDEHAERAVYVVEGTVDLDGVPVPPLSMVTADGPAPARLRATTAARVMLLGGAPLDGPRTIWWNFVSSRKERIAQAKDDWRAGRFAAVPGETDFIPLPSG
ncbi:pirin family protein [Caenispirillum bisanense]|uniref:Pirin n=1 Tax=Caenispirillum bisanense TaxID=414052 RepID=A0A286GW63_9PROT|nr:pirin family protein [Caenispirillum bisanense]SOD99775.1 hypothetical protein SAMN05421508_109171 [Caenispirillum bisanense]